MASFLYLGAGLGMPVVDIIKQKKYTEITEARLTKQELPYTIGMVALDIAAPIFLMIGLTMTSAANVSLLNNEECSESNIEVGKNNPLGKCCHQIKSYHCANS